MSYPYRNQPIQLQWRDRHRQPVQLGSLLLGGLGALALPYGLAERPDAWALHLLLPLLLSGLLLAAPNPPTTGGRLSRNLMALAAAGSTLLPQWQAALILGTPLLLALGSLYQHHREHRHGLLY